MGWRHSFGRTARMPWHLLVAGALVLALAGCSTTTYSVGTLVVMWVPKVAEIALVKRLNQQEAENFRNSHEKTSECVFRGNVYDLYWTDELRSDYVVLYPVDKKTFEVIKVHEIGAARIGIYHGTRNNKPVSKVQVLND